MSLALVTLLLLRALPAVADVQQAKPLPAHSLKVCGKSLALEIASTRESRAMGLMHRTSVPEGTGMLFVYPREETLRFWMKNVPMDIDIGFFDSKGALVGWSSMKGTAQGLSDAEYPIYESQAPARFAVELTHGFFRSAKKARCRLQPLPDATKLRIAIEP
jgi:uncharacterized membrane protein (UPF0127 family)